MPLPVFDRAHFQHMTGGDAALQTEIIGLFRAQAAARRMELEPGGEVWREAAHTLKGSARGIGLMALAEACETAEAGAGDAATLGQVRAALDEAMQTLDAYKADAVSL